jgi:GMP synthase-like glutamine amidotransferase
MNQRIGILLTSNDPSEFARRFPDDGLKVQALMSRVRPDWSYRVWPVKDGEFPPSLDAADGYVITGSPASVHDPLEWIARLMQLIRELHAARKPLVGLCFGHQAIAQALGGTVSRNPGGWRLGTAVTNYRSHREYMQPATASLTLYAAHNEQVTTLPPGAEVLGGDAFCPVGSFAIGSHVLTTEYHPEFNLEFVAALVDELDGKLPADVIATARAHLADRVDGEVFATWMARFFEDSWTA